MTDDNVPDNDNKKTGYSSPLKRLSPLGTIKAKEQPTQIPDGDPLPRSHKLSESAETPLWKKIFPALVRSVAALKGGTALADPLNEPLPTNVVHVKMASEYISSEKNVDTSTANLYLFIIPEITDEKAQIMARDLTQAAPSNGTHLEKVEFATIVMDAFKEIRDISIDYGKEFAHDIVKEAVEVYILAKLAGCLENKLREKPNNPLAKRTADILYKLLAHKADSPEKAIDDTSLMEATGCTKDMAISTLKLAGYRLHSSGLWLPFGIYPKYKDEVS